MKEDRHYTDLINAHNILRLIWYKEVQNEDVK